MILKFNSKHILFLFLILISCSKSNIHISNKFIKEISTINSVNSEGEVSFVPENATSLLYLKLDNNRMASTNAMELQYIYKNYYKNNYTSFYDFLNKTLNQEISLRANQIQRYEFIIFDLDYKIMKIPINQVKKQYLKNIDKETYYFYPRDIALNPKQTILYKMFLDGYLISFDDYGGNYFIKKY